MIHPTSGPAARIGPIPGMANAAEPNSSPHSQEPAFLSPGLLAGPMQAIRYEQNAGVSHDVVPCKQFTAPGRSETEIALCWPSIRLNRPALTTGLSSFLLCASGKHHG
jgi:hypothetical protein